MSIQLHNITEVISQSQAVAQMQSAMQNEETQAVQGAAALQTETRNAEVQVSQLQQTENPEIQQDESGGSAAPGSAGRRKRRSKREESQPASDAAGEELDTRRGRILDVRV